MARKRSFGTLSADTYVKVTGDVLFAGALLVALLTGFWGVMLALLTAAGVGYGTALADVNAGRRLARVSGYVADWRKFRATRGAQEEAPARTRPPAAPPFPTAPTSDEVPPVWPAGHRGAA